MGTLCAVPLLVGLRKLESCTPLLDEGVILAVLICGAAWIINKALLRFELSGLYEADPSEIILDEVVGFFVVALFMPLRQTILIVGFIYFRFFDILKPFGIDRLQTIPGAWGILLDDIAAALCARICMEFTFLLLF
jgi:phosphatidylglycerophosphatase A